MCHSCVSEGCPHHSGPPVWEKLVISFLEGLWPVHSSTLECTPITVIGVERDFAAVCAAVAVAVVVVVEAE